ncbi:MAG: hypothetical protein ACRD2U_10020 [Terriglobales bacterium]
MKNRLESIMQAEERRAEKVQELNALLQDPDLADYVAKLFGEPLTGISSQPAQAPANVNGHKLKSLTLTPALKFIADSLPKRFLVPEVVKTMQEGGFNFGKRNPVPAVRDSLYLLCRGEKPIFRVAIKGEGGKPNTYERI